MKTVEELYEEGIIMKKQEELNALKEEVVTLNEKLHELTDEELEQVTGGDWWAEESWSLADFFKYISED